MRPLFTVLAWLAVAAHLAFLVYLPVGGFLALRWRRSIRVHVPVVLWALGSVTLNLGCPLTSLERWARRGAGMTSLAPSGFIDHYLAGVVYPESAQGAVRTAVFGAVAVSWLLFAATSGRRRWPVVPG